MLAQTNTSNQSSSSSPCLQAELLSCERDERWLFQNLSFSLNAGQVVRIAGPNGSGKSTLIRILMGLSAGYEGHLRWQGKPIDHVRDDFFRSALYLGHQVGVKGRLSAEENLQFWAPNADKKAIYEALSKVGLQGFEDLPTSGLSAGQQRRVALARLFLEEHKSVWVLDEPFTAIDAAGVTWLEHLIQDKAREGGLVILTTHHSLNISHEQIVLGDV